MIVEYMLTEEARKSGLAKPPVRQHCDDAGADIFSFENIVVPARERKTINTGIRIKLPSATVGFINSRSGLAGKQGIAVLNAPGTLDAGYRGEVKVIIINHSDEDLRVKIGDRIAQLL